jgi:hypothetical protein
MIPVLERLARIAVAVSFAVVTLAVLIACRRRESHN